MVLVVDLESYFSLFLNGTLLKNKILARIEVLKLSSLKTLYGYVYFA